MTDQKEHLLLDRFNIVLVWDQANFKLLIKRGRPMIKSVEPIKHTNCGKNWIWEWKVVGFRTIPKLNSSHKFKKVIKFVLLMLMRISSWVILTKDRKMMTTSSASLPSKSAESLTTTSKKRTEFNRKKLQMTPISMNKKKSKTK